MPRIMTQHLVPGMIVAEDVFAFNGQMIIPKDMVLTDKAITKLEFYSVVSVRIKEESASITPEEREEETYSQKIKNSAEYKEFKANFEESVEEFHDNVNDIVTKNVINTDALLSESEKVLDENPNGIHIFDMLHNMRMYDDSTYAHCMNVSLICNVFGRWLKFPDEDLKVLTLCGLLHDIGKLKIPGEIVGKPAKLTDEEYKIIKTHTLEGYNILKKLPINPHIKNAALMHHEKCDGTGYPVGLTTDRIDPFARIVAIADVYDAMTSARVYRGPLCPFKVIEIFESEGLQKYDPKYIMTFLEYIVNTYMNNRVKLSNGMEGDIVLINKLNLSHPMVRVGDKFINLSEQTDISIEAII
ncbi:MAG: HD-GYP domain-containing protein [Lachnospiraceae bacterium]|nr:HD-GYP domain-containing protein [Lachnospiraceae bacterium]